MALCGTRWQGIKGLLALHIRLANSSTMRVSANTRCVRNGKYQVCASN